MLPAEPWAVTRSHFPGLYLNELLCLGLLGNDGEERLRYITLSSFPGHELHVGLSICSPDGASRGHWSCSDHSRRWLFRSASSRLDDPGLLGKCSRDGRPQWKALPSSDPYEMEARLRENPDASCPVYLQHLGLEPAACL